MKSLLEATTYTVAISTPWPFITLPNGKRVHEPMTPVWHRCRHNLSLPTNFNIMEVGADGLKVDEARNRVARICLDHKPRPEFLFFLDYDVFVPGDALTKLFWRARCQPRYDIYCGIYCCKGLTPADPLIYAENGTGPFWDFSVGDILTTDGHNIRSVHMGLTLIRTSLFQRMLDAGVVHGDGTNLEDEPWFLTTQAYGPDGFSPVKSGGTEDIWFCTKAREVNCKILVDTSVLAPHYDKNTGNCAGLPADYGPCKRAEWMGGADSLDHKKAKELGLKLALDVGAGGERRHWDGYKTYTTDIRPGVADYTQDSRWLNLPNDHFDLVATSHHLEHFGRFDQEIVWKECVRVLKPGGKVEMIVPNIEWAAHLIAEGTVDEHVLNVLYGAQEEHGYERELNTHFFGYTPAIAKELARSVGLVNIKTRSYQEDDNLGYNLILTAEKPGVPSPEPERKEPAATPVLAETVEKGDGNGQANGREHAEPDRDLALRRSLVPTGV